MCYIFNCLNHNCGTDGHCVSFALQPCAEHQTMCQFTVPWPRATDGTAQPAIKQPLCNLAFSEKTKAKAI